MFPKISNNKNFENKKSTLILFATFDTGGPLFPSEAKDRNAEAIQEVLKDW
jgi:hypothetical protein